MYYYQLIFEGPVTSQAPLQSLASRFMNCTFSPIAMSYYCCVTFFITSCMREIWTVIISIRYSIIIPISLLCGSSHRRRLLCSMCCISSCSRRTFNRTMKGCERIIIRVKDVNAVCILCTAECNY